MPRPGSARLTIRPVQPSTAARHRDLPYPGPTVRGCPAAINGFSQCLQNNTLYRARNFLLTGVVIYLAGEWSGSLWCLNWLGDTWRWSGGFFKSAVVFLLVIGGLSPAAGVCKINADPGGYRIRAGRILSYG